MLINLGLGAIYEDSNESAVLVKVVIYDLIKGSHDITKDGTDNTTKEKPLKMKDGLGNSAVSTAENVQYVEARYLNGGSHMVSTPSFSQGEQVEVFQSEGTDRYYFKPFHMDKDLRKKERVVFAVSNLDRDKESDHGKHVDKDTSYSMTVDTKGKLIEIKTSVSDGEPILFTISIDTKNGVFRIEDSNDQSLNWDAVKGVLDIEIPTINLKVDDFNVKGKKFNYDASDSIKLKTKTNKVKAENTTMDTKVEYKKSEVHNAVNTFKGAVNFKAPSDFKGPVKMNFMAKTTDGASVL